MRFFEELILKKPTESIVLVSIKEAEILVKALELYVEQNKKAKNAKKLLSEITQKWAIY